MIIIEYMNFRGSLYQALLWRSSFPLSALFGAVVIYVLFGVLLLVCRKAVITGAILGLFTVLASYINYVKMATNGDNFFPRDIAMAGSAGQLTSFISGDVPNFFWLGIIVMIVWLIILGLFNIEIPMNWKFRLPAATALILTVVMLFSSNSRVEGILNRFNISFNDTVLQSSNYRANGFIGAFTVNLLNMGVERPADYSREAILALLDGFDHTHATEDYFDVIVVLSEGFFDIRILPGVEFSYNPLPHFDEIITRPNSYSGLVYTTALNGGTIRPEFDVLTGLTTDFLPSGSVPYEFVRRPMATYVSNYQDAGYRTVGLHPFTERFYMRHVAFPLMGFDKFLGYECLSQQFDFVYSQNFVSDISFFDAIEYQLDAALADDVPIFLFATTMQNHQPFPPLAPEDIRINITSEDLYENVLATVTSYTHGLADADTMLGMLADHIDNRPRPTIMLFFGDHLPNLGSHLAAFTQTGLIGIEDMDTPEARAIRYSTPFIIYTNRDLAPIISNRDNHISTYYLLSIIAYQTGFHRTPYMNLLLDYFEQIPFHNVRLHHPETEISRSLERTKQLITYDRLIGQAYSASGS